MGRAGSNRGLPHWYKGRLINDDIGGFWYGEREGKLSRRRGLLVDRANFDSLTEQERADFITRRKAMRKNFLNFCLGVLFLLPLTVWAQAPIGGVHRIFVDTDIASTASASGAVVNVSRGGNFGLWYKATSATSTPDVKIQAYMSPNETDSFAIPEGVGDIETNLTVETERVQALAIPPMHYLMIRAEGNSGNPADTVLSLRLFLQEDGAGWLKTGSSSSSTSVIGATKKAMDIVEKTTSQALGTAALDYTSDFGVKTKIQGIYLHADGAITETVTIGFNSSLGASYDTLILSEGLSAETDVVYFPIELVLEAGDEIDIDVTDNGGVQTVYVVVKGETIQ